MKRTARILLALTVGLAVAWGQGGGRRGATTQQTPPAGNTGRGAPGGAGATPPAAAPGGGGSGDFFNFDSTAGGIMPIPEAAPVETHGKVTVNGEAVAYTARAGFMPLRNATTGQTEAHIFYTAYTKDGGTDAIGRPMVFFVGGAPGVAAAWQEFGGLGPKRMKWAADGSTGPAPYGWTENPNTLLGQADLVFVNPVGTAFSRPSTPARGANFWTTAGDAASLAEFVRSYVVANNRRNSPLFLAGEDFGTGRASGLALYLIEHQIPIQGVALLNTTLSPDSQAGDVQFLTMLPSLVMTAWHHKKLSPELSAMSAEQISGQARQFASREYLHALYKGDRMTAEERTKVVADLSRLTGLSKQFVISNDLRITLDRFNNELLRDQQRALSASDARVTGYLPGPVGGGGRNAPIFGGGPIDFNLVRIGPGFQTAYEDYLHRELTFSNPNSGLYYLSSGGVGPFTVTGSGEASLSGAFARNPNMRLFVGINYFDLNAPFYATEYTVAHLNVSPEARLHITIGRYEAGQMAYADSKAAAKLQADLSRFVTEAAARK